MSSFGFREGYLNTSLTVIMMFCVVVILVNATWRCTQVLTGRIPPLAAPEGVI